MRIRAVTAGDMDDIERLEQSCFEDPYPREFLEELASGSPTTFLVAQSGDEIVGYAVLDKWEDNNHLVSIAVYQSWRRKGIGRQLLMAVEESGVKGRPIRLEVRESNAAAIGLYLKNGFKAVGLRARYYRDGENALLMEKEHLSNPVNPA